MVGCAERVRCRQRGPYILHDPLNRGDWHSFEPLATMAERYVDAFASSTPPYLRQLADIARKSA
jgi:hypothetical protein